MLADLGKLIVATNFRHCTPALLPIIFGVAVALWSTPSFGQDELAVEKLQAKYRKTEGSIRIATFNVSLNRRTYGKLRDDLLAGDEQATKVARVIRLLQPDILLLNELDFDADSPTAQLQRQSNAGIFADKFLAATETDQFGNGPWEMSHVFVAPVNTGVPSGLDLDGNGKFDEPNDAWGYGVFPGQYGMAVLSRFPIDRKAFRSWQKFRWAALPGAQQPIKDDGSPFYPAKIWERLRISSKSMWDVPIGTPLGGLHVLASHPTPPAFDGPEDRNGLRNRDEIRLIELLINNDPRLVDDQKGIGGLKETDPFVIMGDLNSDPYDGGSISEAINGLLNHPRVAKHEAPRSQGAMVAAKQQGKSNAEHKGDPSRDTADFNDKSVGNLRVDYVLPSAEFRVVGSGVFWPELQEFPREKRQALLESLQASDHHAVWCDLILQ